MTDLPNNIASVRTTRIREIARDCIQRRAAGEPLSDDDVLSRHADLMPELGDELRKLARIRATLRTADSSAAPNLTLSPKPPADQAGLPTDAFPGYSLVGEIHRGGQGVVYRAVEHGTDRSVAIKVVREGPFAGRNDRARFEREARILAGLNHPNIVAIHATGTSHGVLYLVMDFIDGSALDEHFAEIGTKPRDRRDVRERLRLFATICDAVNQAHLRGVIHRDIKPGNLRIDRDGKPHVLDFGLARVDAAADSSEVKLESLTDSGQFVGSLPWTSPEQAAGHTDAVDVRTDVYALGVVLFQMLTGEFPYTVRGAVTQVVENILHTPPTRPRTLCPAIDDEVETIVLRCLSKEPDRRYAGAGELARDIERYLAGEAIEAKRDSRWYVFRKFVKRHSLPVTFAATLVVVLVASAITLGMQAYSLALARDAESDARQTAERVTEFLEEALGSADPLNPGARPDLTVKEMLDAAAARADIELADEPAALAGVQLAIGAAYNGIGIYDSADQHLQAALELRTELFGEDSPGVAEVHAELAKLRQAEARYDEAATHANAALAIRMAALPETDPAIAESLTRLAAILREQGHYEESEAASRDALALLRASSQPDGRALAECLSGLGGTLQLRHDYAGAEQALREALDLDRQVFGEQHPEVASSLNNLAAVLAETGDAEQAEPLYREALDMTRAIAGDRHPRVARILSNLAALLAAKGQTDEAAQLYAEALDIRGELRGTDDADYAAMASNYGVLLIKQQRYADAVEQFERSIAAYQQQLGENHPSVATMLYNLGEAYRLAKDYEQAQAAYEQSLAIRRVALEPTHPDLAKSLVRVAELAAARGDRQTAEADYREAIDIRRQSLGEDDPQFAELLNTLGLMLKYAGRLDEAESLYREALDIRRRTLGETEETATSLNNLAALLKQTNRLDEAAQLYTEALTIRRNLPGDNRQHIAISLNNIAQLAAEQGDDEAALAGYAEAAALFEATLGEQHWLTAAVRSNHAAALTRLGRYDEAEPELLAAVEVLTEGRGEAHELTQLCTARLVELYDATDRADAAADWRARLAAPASP